MSNQKQLVTMQLLCIFFPELSPSYWFHSVARNSHQNEISIWLCNAHQNQRDPFQLWGRGEKGLRRKPFQDWDFLTRHSDFFQNYCTLVGTSTAVAGMAVRWKTPQPVCSSTTISCEQLLLL